ncbi:MAG: dGTPase, partial [Candidatus Nephrothrix sp. EaCA]
GKNNSRKYENLSLLLPEDIRLNIVQNPTPYLVIRHVMDFISSLTDRHALSLYRLIRG